MFESEALWQVFVSIRLFQNNFQLTAGVVILNVSITTPIMVSNVSQDFDL